MFNLMIGRNSFYLDLKLDAFLLWVAHTHTHTQRHTQAYTRNYPHL